MLSNSIRVGSGAKGPTLCPLGRLWRQRGKGVGHWLWRQWRRLPQRLSVYWEIGAGSGGGITGVALPMEGKAEGQYGGRTFALGAAAAVTLRSRWPDAPVLTGGITGGRWVGPPKSFGGPMGAVSLSGPAPRRPKLPTGDRKRAPMPQRSPYLKPTPVGKPSRRRRMGDRCPRNSANSPRISPKGAPAAAVAVLVWAI